MLVRRLVGARSLIFLELSHHRSRRLQTAVAATPPPPPTSDQVVQVCTILFQQQDSPDSKLHKKLSSLPFPHTSNEFFLQVCNAFPYSWRPVRRFFLYSTPSSSVAFNKMIDVAGKARNVALLWEILGEAGCRGLANDRTFVVAARALAGARELGKLVKMMEGCGLERLNKVVAELCRGGQWVGEAAFLVRKLEERVKGDGVTFGWLVRGFCEVGDVVEASKVWNLMVDRGMEPAHEVFEKMIETFFKRNEDVEALKVFDVMRGRGSGGDLGRSCYRIVIDWMCRKGKIAQAKMVFDEMRDRGIEPDNATLGYLVYGLLARRRVNEANMVVEGIRDPDISVYHGMIKGLLRLRRASAATDVFREMIRRGCEPIMHTYVMLLQGHLGKRGRKGPHPSVNFDSIFVGGLVNAGKALEATKYVERMINGGVDVPRFDYNKFLHYYSNEEGAIMFEQVAKRLREVELVDLADIFQRYGEKMATRDRRRIRDTPP